MALQMDQKDKYTYLLTVMVSLHELAKDEMLGANNKDINNAVLRVTESALKKIGFLK